MCLPALENKFLVHSAMVPEDTIAGVFLTVLGAMLWSLHQGDIPLLIGQWQGVVSHLLASEIPRGGEE